jgi:pimeloyl-ACP methyl ester carboxylesterase
MAGDAVEIRPGLPTDEPRWIDVTAPAVQLRALGWGPADGPIALCLHGFPDTAYGWRKVGPVLADAGWRVVAPFMRGYVPSSVPSDHSYHVGALMDDALQVLRAAGPTGRDVVIGHDWGAIAGAGLAAMPDSPFTKAVIMSVPPPRAFWPRRGLGVRRSLAALLPAQVARFWHVWYFQLPWLPERSASWVVPLLWRRWSPGYNAKEDLRHVDAAIGVPRRWHAALGPYRAVLRKGAPEQQYADLQRHYRSAFLVPTLYLHGTDDGCLSVKFGDRVRGVLPGGSATHTVERAGHFLQLEQPDVVARHILDFIGPGR